MPRKKIPCPKCGEPMQAISKTCRKCSAPYVRTEEHRKQQSDNKKGIPPRGKGWKHSEETKSKISSAWTEEMKIKAKARGEVMAENTEWRLDIARKLQGENNPNYQGKNNHSPYDIGWSKSYRKKMHEQRERCEHCGSAINLDLHHKDFQKTNHDPNNLLLLCRSCHKKVHAEHRQFHQQKGRPAIP